MQFAQPAADERIRAVGAGGLETPSALGIREARPAKLLRRGAHRSVRASTPASKPGTTTPKPSSGPRLPTRSSTPSPVERVAGVLQRDARPPGRRVAGSNSSPRGRRSPPRDPNSKPQRWHELGPPALGARDSRSGWQVPEL